MDPLDEKELSPLLRRWEAPQTPSSLSDRVLPARVSWWRWLMTGTIRVPVPVGFAALAILVAWMLYSRPAPPPVAAPSVTNTLADFQPWRQLEPRIIGENNENNELPRK
jgi:hypothetical protein